MTSVPARRECPVSTPSEREGGRTLTPHGPVHLDTHLDTPWTDTPWAERPAGRSRWLRAVAGMPRARVAIPGGVRETVRAALVVAAVLASLAGPTDSVSVQAPAQRSDLRVHSTVPQWSPSLEGVGSRD